MEVTTPESKTTKTNVKNSKKGSSESKSSKSNEASPTDKIIDKKTSFEWSIGCIVEARDKKALKETFYKSKIIALRNDNEAKIHFLGWNSRYDQWYDIYSGDLKPCVDENSNTAETESTAGANEFEIGTRVMAKWKMDENYYPATVKRLVEKDKKKYYEILFYDGVKRLIQRSEVKELTEEVAKLFPDVTLQTTKNELDKQEKKDEDLRRAEAELLLAIQQPQLIVSSDNESLTDAKVLKNTNIQEKKEKTTPHVECVKSKKAEILSDNKIEVDTKIVGSSKTELENEKNISDLDGTNKQDELVIEAVNEAQAPVARLENNQKPTEEGKQF